MPAILRNRLLTLIVLLCVLVMVCLFLIYQKSDSDYSGQQFTFHAHPRIIDNTPVSKSELLGYLKAEFELDQPHYCNSSLWLDNLACLQLIQHTDNDAITAYFQRHLLKALNSITLVAPELGQSPGNAWMLAILYDQHTDKIGQLINHNKEIIEQLASHLQDYLSILNGSNASLWHSRLSYASYAFIIAVVIGDKYPTLFEQSLFHFKDALKAMEITEGWPGGYSYWINNRALPFLLASSAYQKGVDEPAQKKLNKLLERIGLWHIYMTRPDNRIAPTSDEGPRTDLKDETRKAIDLLTKLTKNPVFANYSRYIQNLHGKASYYPDYYWLLPFVIDPDLYKNLIVSDDLSMFTDVLPTTEVFGKGAFNQIVMRSGWSSSDSFIQIRGGGIFSHHQHYDSGHFSIYSQKPVISDAGRYFNNYYKASRLNFSIRSVSKNTLLLPLSGEEIKPNRFFVNNVNSGGQAILLPTGSAIRSTNDWLSSGAKYKGTKLVRINSVEGLYAFSELEMSSSYNVNNFKANSITRRYLFLPRSHQLMIFDRLTGVAEGIQSKVQFHLNSQPKVTNPKTLVGNEIEGIYEVKGDEEITLINSPASISLLYPLKTLAKSYIGKKYSYFVESKTDDGSEYLDQSEGAVDQPWFDNPHYRIEWQQLNHNSIQEFVTAISLKQSSPPARLTEQSEHYRAYQLNNTLVIELLSESKNIAITPGDYQQIIVLASKPQTEITLEISDQHYLINLEQGIGCLKVLK